VNDAEARNYYERALKADAAFVPARLGLAELALKDGDLDGAEREVAAAVEADPSSRRAYGFRGVVRQRRGELEEAADDFNRALKDEPYAPATHAALAQTYYLLGNYEAAANEYRAAVALNGDRGVYYLGLGRALEGTGAVDAARLNYVIAAEKAGGDADVAVAALKEGGRLAYLMGEVEQAEADLERATALAPGDGEAYGELGIVYMMETRPGDAAGAFETAAVNEPSRADWWYYLGVCRADVGDYGGAEEALLKAGEALAVYHRPDDKVTVENIEDVLAAVRAVRASLGK
jgi:tetratricopeptide (TPR) repeat protein